MTQTFKRIMQVALATVAASAVTVGLSAPPASAAGENTWIRSLNENRCITTWGGDVFLDACVVGDKDQLWDRRDDATIHRAWTNLCLDSNQAGDVYYLECNNGPYQKWRYYDNGWVQNQATGLYLYTPNNSSIVTSISNGVEIDRWQFFGG
ncbi:ricin-type beta-trefoil lectin domain protein [Nonomuraea sp. NPDC049784]|uniref:RICIN domain-containing protein n=1 Tax=Nonomuraea sp. NPDC049784 TaxID=3154361 RepID=UPI003405182E